MSMPTDIASAPRAPVPRSPSIPLRRVGWQSSDSGIHLGRAQGCPGMFPFVGPGHLENVASAKGRPRSWNTPEAVIRQSARRAQRRLPGQVGGKGVMDSRKYRGFSG